MQPGETLAVRAAVNLGGPTNAPDRAAVGQGMAKGGTLFVLAFNGGRDTH
jgi:hypothetical protein